MNKWTNEWVNARIVEELRKFVSLWRNTVHCKLRYQPLTHISSQGSRNYRYLVYRSQIVNVAFALGQSHTGKVYIPVIPVFPLPLSLHLSPLRDWIPSKIELPIEATPRHVTAGYILESLVTDDVDDRANHRLLIPLYLGQERLQPPCKRGVELLVCVWYARCLSLCLPVFLSVYICLCLCLSVCGCLSLWVSICQTVFLGLCLSLYWMGFVATAAQSH